jgi:hypothetical protein
MHNWTSKASRAAFGCRGPAALAYSQSAAAHRRPKRAAYLWLPAILCCFVALATGEAQAAESANNFEYRSLSGFGNNKEHPTWGEAFTQQPRVAPARYRNGVDEMINESERPNPRYVSNRVFNAGERDVRSPSNQSQWVWTWGQFIDHDLDKAVEGEVAKLHPIDAEGQALTLGEAANIPVSSSDPLEAFKTNLGFIPFERRAWVEGTSASHPRQYVNELPSFIDGFDIYGDEQSRLEWLRTGPDNGNPADAGAEFMLPGGYFPRETARGSGAAELAKVPHMELEGGLVEGPQDAVVTGDIRGNENDELMGTMLLMAREHNRIVKELPANLSEEEKFQIARKVVGAEIQYITYNEFLPALGIHLAPYKGYEPHVNPSVSLEFSTDGYRFHSIVNGEEEVEVSTTHYTPAQLEKLESRGVGVIPIQTFEGDKPGYRLVIPQTVAFFDPDVTETLGLGPELQGLATGITSTGYRNDEQITNELRSTLFQIPTTGRSGFECFNEPELPGCFTGVSDLGAFDVQRGFDTGMPSYNQLRTAYGLAPQKTFDEVTGESGSEALPAGDTINTPAIMNFTSLENFWHEPLPVNSGEDATYDTRASTLAARLKAVYGSVENLDAFTGMLSEPTHPGTVGGEVGELQEAIVSRQFEAARDGDRFFYLNDPDLATIEQKYGISYKHSLAELISADTGVPSSSLQPNVFFASTPPHHIYKPQYKKWTVSGNVLTDKHNGRAVTLESGTFDGSGEVNRETGAGSLSGTISTPRDTSSVELGGSQGDPSLDITLSPVGAVAASTANSGGLEQLSAPLEVHIGFTKIGNHPIDCETAEPVQLKLADTLDLEELLTQGWHFTGTTTIPEITCEARGGHKDPSPEDLSLGQALSAAFSGSENHFSLAITAPGSS